MVASAQSPGRSSLMFQIPRPLGSSITIPPVKTAGTTIATSPFKIDHQLTVQSPSERSLERWQEHRLRPSRCAAPPRLRHAERRCSGPAQKTLRLSHDWVITPTTVNHLSAGHTRQYQRLEAEEAGRRLGRSSWASLALANGAFPTINAGFLAGGLAWGRESGACWLPSPNTFLLADSLSMVKGKHNLKFGFDFPKVPEQSSGSQQLRKLPVQPQ